MITCPVCKKENLADDCLCCPICKTDLKPLLRVRQLHLAEYDEAIRFSELGAIDNALHHAAAALALNPSFVPARILVGKLLWKQGHQADALRCWEEAARLAPKDRELQSLLQQKPSPPQPLPPQRSSAPRMVYVALGLVLLGVISYSAFFIHPRLVALGGKTAQLEAAQSQLAQPWSVPQSDWLVVSNTLAQVRQQASGLLGGTSTLSNSQQALMAELKAMANLMAAEQTSVHTLEGELADYRKLTTNLMAAQWSELSKKIEATLQRMDALDQRLAALGATQATMTAWCQGLKQFSSEWRQELQSTRQAALGLQNWITNTAEEAVHLLKPAAIESLAAQRAALEYQLTQLRLKETQTKNYSNLFGLISHARTQSKIETAQKNLAILEAQWQKEADPWIRFEMLMRTNLPSLGLRP